MRVAVPADQSEGNADPGAGRQLVQRADSVTEVLHCEGSHVEACVCKDPKVLADCRQRGWTGGDTVELAHEVLHKWMRGRDVVERSHILRPVVFDVGSVELLEGRVDAFEDRAIFTINLG